MLPSQLIMIGYKELVESFSHQVKNLKPFIDKVECIVNEIVQNNIETASGDDYITSLTAACLYQYRF